MTQRKPNDPSQGIAEYRASQTGWRADSTSRGPRVDLVERMRDAGDTFYDKLFGAINAGLHPIDTLRDSPRGIKVGLAGTAAILLTGTGANYLSHTPRFETPQGVEELNVIGKNVDGRSGIEEARVNMYLSELPGVFSADGQEQLKKAALQTDSSPLLGGGDFEQTQRGLDAMIVVSQIIEAHDLGEGRFLEFQDEELQQLQERLDDFEGSGLAHEEIATLIKGGDVESVIGRLQDLGQNRDAAHAVLDGKTIVNLQGSDAGNTIAGPDQGR